MSKATEPGREKGALGTVPKRDELNWAGLDFPTERFEELMAVGRDAGLAEAHSQAEFFKIYSGHLPGEIAKQRDMLETRLNSMSEATRAA